MHTIKSQEIALLGLLLEGAKHAYQVEQEVAGRDMRFWTDLSMSAIYKTLRSLESRGLTETEVRLTDKNVAQKVHRITSQGVAVLKESIRSLFETAQAPKEPIDLGLSNLFVLTTDEALQSIDDYAGSLQELLQGYRDLEVYLLEHECPPFRLALAQRRVAMLIAEQQWLTTYRATVQKEGTDL